MGKPLVLLGLLISLFVALCYECSVFGDCNNDTLLENPQGMVAPHARFYQSDAAEGTPLSATDANITIAETDKRRMRWAIRNGGAEQFDDSVLNFPNRTYGIPNEPCVVPGPGDITVSTEADLQSQVENVANVGKNVFMNAGTYTLTSDLDLQTGVKLRPNNCAVVTIAGTQASGIRPCQDNVIAGMKITRIRTSASTIESAIEYSRGLTCSGSIVQNNDIQSSGANSVGFTNGTFNDTYTRGNRFIPGTTFSNSNYHGFIGSDFDIEAPITCTTVTVDNVVFEDNMHDTSPGALIATENAYHAGSSCWDGNYTIRRDYFKGAVGGQGGSDLKWITNKNPQNNGGVVTIEDNYLDGSGASAGDGVGVTGDCILSHRAIVATYTIHVRGNYFTNCTTGYVHFIEDGTVAPFDGVQAFISNNIFISPVSTNRAVDIQRNLADVRNNTFTSGEIQIGRTGTVEHPEPTGILFDDNILYNTRFDFEGPGPYALQSCVRNQFFNTLTPPTGCTDTLTSDPQFVNPASDWHLQTGSPAIGTGTRGLDRGAYSQLHPTAHWPLYCSLNSTNPANFVKLTTSCASSPFTCIATDSVKNMGDATTVPLATNNIPLDGFIARAGIFVVDTPNEGTTVFLDIGRQTEFEYGLAFGSGLAENDVIRCEPRWPDGTRFTTYLSPLPTITIDNP